MQYRDCLMRQIETHLIIYYLSLLVSLRCIFISHFPVLVLRLCRQRPYCCFQWPTQKFIFIWHIFHQSKFHLFIINTTSQFIQYICHYACVFHCMVVLLSQSFRRRCCGWCITTSRSVDKPIEIYSGDILSHVRILPIARWWTR